MPWIMAIRKGNDNGRPIRRVGPLLGSVREDENTGASVQALQEAATAGGATGSDRKDDAYNRDEEGLELKFAGKRSGGAKLTDDAVAYCRTVVGRRTIKELAAEHHVSYYTMWNAVKGYTYKHLNHRFAPRFR